MIFSILKSLSLGVWLGALLMLGIAVAGPIFQNSPSKTIAGNINAIILSRMNTLEWICGLIALISSAILLIVNWQGEWRNIRMIETAMIVVMLVILWVYSSSISSRMETLRATIKDFDHPQQTTEYVEAKSEFDTLHKRYTMLVSANLFLLAGTFIVSMMTVRR
jgi:hypothetical protein